MITLYHCVSARSFRPLWRLEELELPYELVMLPFPPRALARSYLDINPLGTVPLIPRAAGTARRSSGSRDFDHSRARHRTPSLTRGGPTDGSGYGASYSTRCVS